MAAPRQVGFTVHQLARGDYCRLTMSRTKPAIVRLCDQRWYLDRSGLPVVDWPAAIIVA